MYRRGLMSSSKNQLGFILNWFTELIEVKSGASVGSFCSTSFLNVPSANLTELEPPPTFVIALMLDCKRSTEFFKNPNDGIVTREFVPSSF